jgi:hypothetical protein
VSLLPIHPQPKKGEILSSWMVRLSISNHFQLHTFYSKLLGYDHAIWNRDVDRNPSTALLEILADCSGCSLSRIKSMTLGNFDGLLYEDVRLNGVAKWILPIGVFHRMHRRRGMQCCPLCLQQDVPFFSLKWRVSIFSICEVHKCFLIDACPQCGATIEYHRLGIARGEFIPHTQLSKCSRCGFNLSASPVVRPEMLPERIVNDYTKILWMISNSCWDDKLNLPAFYPLSFFDGLKALLRLVNKRSAVALREYINSQFPIELPVRHSVVTEFGYLSVEQRFKLVVTCLWLLHEWPDRLVTVLRGSHLSRSRITEEPENLPFWLLRPLNEHLDLRVYSPSIEEVLSIKNFLIRQGKNGTAREIAELLGIGAEYVRPILQSMCPPSS